jgi:hypothetical protein
MEIFITHIHVNGFSCNYLADKDCTMDVLEYMTLDRLILNIMLRKMDAKAMTIQYTKNNTSNNAYFKMLF